MDLAYSIRQAWINEPPLRERTWSERLMLRLWEKLGMIETPNWDVLRRFG